MGARPRRRRRPASKLRLRRWLRRQDRFTRRLLVGVIALTVLVVAMIAPRVSEERRDPRISRGAPAGGSASRTPERRAAAERTPPSRPIKKARAPQPPSPPPSLTKSAPSGRRAVRAVAERAVDPRAAIVIDDLGQSFSHFEQLAGLNIPLSIAVIPGLPASARTVNEASRRGVEMLLHQPMEPREEGGKSAGAGVLLTSMSPETMRTVVRANLAAVPGAVGVNNHMGSRFTADAASLGTVMAEIKQHGLFWLDSRTTSETRGIEVARAAGVPALARDVFIDAEVNADFIRRQVRSLIQTARVQGTAVGIGHPHPETIAVLRELRAELLASGVALVPLSRLVRPPRELGTETALAAALEAKSGPAEPGPSRKTPIP